MAEKKVKRKRHPSLLWGAVNRLCAMIYSFFINGRIGDMLSSGDTLCKRSYLANVFTQKRGNASRVLLKYPEAVMERSRTSRAMVFARVFLASLRLNVYGMFFAFFGLTSGIVSFIPVMLRGLNALDEGRLITSVIIVLCSVPLLFSSQSAAEAISGSRLMSKIALDVLCVPEEKLRSRRQYGGTMYMFIASLVAMVLGALSYYSDPMYVPMALLGVIVLFLVFSSPESGVIITLALTPFMQYFKNSKAILLVLIAMTAISYFCKVFQKRRQLALSPEISMVLLFCGFTFMGGLFSHGGAETLLDSVFKIAIILGGFLLTYNLINSEKLLDAAFKTMTVSFIALCIMGVWESFFYGISNRIIDSVSPNIFNLSDERVLFLADNGIVFGMFAILIFPMLFAYISKQKSAKGIALIVSLCILAIITAWMRSHYEVMVALIIELVIYWFMYSHKTLTTVIFALIPIGIAVMLYPYAVAYLHWPNISEILMEYMPASVANSAKHSSVIKDVFAMVMDGNFVGIGAGEHAFVSLFPAYASAASVGATNSMSLWLEILCWSGIFGFASFFIFVIFLVKRTCGFLIDQRSSNLRSCALALFCGLIAAMLFGFVYSIWVDDRILYLFWAFAGLLMGYIRLGRDREEIRRTEFRDVKDERDVELVFYE